MNLHIVQHALRHSNDRTMNTDLAYFVQNRLVDRRHIKAHNHMQLQHKSRVEDASVRRLFPLSNIAYYQSLNIGHIRLCTRSYSHAKYADDSNIIF